MTNNLIMVHLYTIVKSYPFICVDIYLKLNIHDHFYNISKIIINQKLFKINLTFLLIIIHSNSIKQYKLI